MCVVEPFGVMRVLIISVPFLRVISIRVNIFGFFWYAIAGIIRRAYLTRLVVLSDLILCILYSFCQ